MKKRSLKRFGRPRRSTVDNIKVSQDNILKKFETLEQELKEIREGIFLSKKENNPIKAETVIQDLGIIVGTLRKENEVLKRDVYQLLVALVDMKASKQELQESRTLHSKTDEVIIKVKQDLKKTVDSLQKALNCEVDAIGNHSELTAKKDLITTLDSLLKENKSLKCEVYEIAKKAELAKKDLITPVDSLQKENKVLKCKIDIDANEAQIAKTDLKASDVELLQRENQELKCEIDQLRSNVESLKSEMAREIEKRDDLITKLEDKLDMRKASYDLKLQSLVREKVEICRKLEESKLEVEQIRSKSKVFEQHFSAEKVKKLIAQVNELMDIGRIDSAISTFTSYVFNVNVINNFSLVHVFNKIYRIKEQLRSFEEQLLHSDSCNLITLTYNELKNNIDYPNLILNVEKKLLKFCRDRNFLITAFSLCDTLIRIRKCKDPWVYFEQGELLFLRGDYHGAREAFFCSLKFSKEGDSDLQIKYEQACKTLKLQVITNIWTLFDSDGIPLSNKSLNSKYKELIRYYHPDKQHGFVKQYKDVAECMSKELTKAYRTLTEQP